MAFGTRHIRTFWRLGILATLGGCGLSFDGILEGASPSTDAGLDGAPAPKDAALVDANEPDSAPPANCTNLVKDGDESDVDCGGSCAKRCAEARACAVSSDCDKGLLCNGTACVLPTTCKALKDARATTPSGNYKISPLGVSYEVGCDMDLFGGGFTLAMKVDGAQTTFSYEAPYWTNALLYEEQSFDLRDRKETKLKSFNDLAFADVALVFETAGVSRTARLPVAKSSLIELFATRTATNLGRNGWMDLVPGGSLQTGCNAEGTSIEEGSGAKVRLGILANDTPDCLTPDSYVGVGGVGKCGKNTRAGNVACFNGTGGDRNLVSFVRIFVR